MSISTFQQNKKAHLEIGGPRGSIALAATAMVMSAYERAPST